MVPSIGSAIIKPSWPAGPAKPKSMPLTNASNHSNMSHTSLMPSTSSQPSFQMSFPSSMTIMSVSTAIQSVD
eukprot:4227498-Ditylum_brightwellii.AAC.1